MNALYPVIRLWARAGLWLFTERISVRNQSEAAPAAPAILACTHPNSFLDAVIMGVIYPRPVYFLARGDAFAHPLAARLLRAVGALPIYRLREGREHLHRNDQTFQECLDIFRKGGTILIFPEGLSEQGTEVKPLKKGAARLARLAWQDGGLEHVTVQPAALRYHSFTRAPKRIAVGYGHHIGIADIPAESGEAHFYQAFNAALHQRLSATVPDERDTARRTRSMRWLLLPLALTGWLLQGWFYLLIKRLVRRKTAGTVFYDSVLFSLLLFSYPLLVLLLATIATGIGGLTAGLIMVAALPVTAWAMKAFKG